MALTFSQANAVAVIATSSPSGYHRFRYTDKAGKVLGMEIRLIGTNTKWVPPKGTVEIVAVPQATGFVTQAVAPAPTTTPPTTTPPVQPPTTTTPPVQPPTTTPPVIGTAVKGWEVDASNTGLTVPASSLTAYSGPFTGTVEKKTISGTVRPSGPVVFKNCLFDAKGSPYCVQNDSGRPQFYDCEFTGATTAAIAFDNWECYRCDFHDLPADAVKLGNNVKLHYSYFHDMVAGPGEHADGGQVQNGVVNLEVIGNNMGSPSNASIFFAPDLGPSTAGPVLIKDNLFGGGNYSLYVVDGGDGKYAVSNVNVVGNRFLRNYRYGAARIAVVVNGVDITAKTVTWTDNAYHDNGEAIHP